MVKKSIFVETPRIPDNIAKKNEKNGAEIEIPEVEVVLNGSDDKNTSETTKPLEKSASNASALHLIKKGTTLQVLRGIIADYSDATSIHGIKYFGSRKKRWYERIIWFALVCASMYYGTILTLQTWNNWYNNPVIVGLAESSTPIWDIPFPAVTICPLIKYKHNQFNDGFLHTLDKPSFDKYLQIYKNAEKRQQMSIEDIKKLEAISHVCITNLLFFKSFAFPIHSKTAMTPERLNKLRKYKEKLPNLLKSVAPQINETFESVKWRKAELKNFQNEIKYVLTNDGICFSFNALDDAKIFRDSSYGFQLKNSTKKVSWSLERGYRKKADTVTYPRRVLAGDVDESFFVKLRANLLDMDNSCGGKSQGFKIILHTPNEFPQVSKRFFRVPYKQIVSVAVKPNMITTSPDVRSYEPAKRQCFFNNEKYLKYFKFYTQANCEHECFMNATITACQCSNFYMPMDEKYDYCGPTQIECYRNVRKELLQIDGFKTVCNCLPACTSIAYDAEVTQSILKDTEVDDEMKASNISNMENEYSKSIMNVYFAKNQFLSAKRSELYGIADLVANVGGLFGLFMGVSILSIVELIYFCTLRLCINMQMRKKAKKKLEKKSKKLKSAD